jgi:hypothetical protein
MAAIQYSEIIHDTVEFSSDFEGKDGDSFSLLQNPTKTPIISKDFLGGLPHCAIIHWVSQMCNNPKLCFCPCSIHSSPWRENNKIFIHDDHECKMGLMTPQELLKHVNNEGDYTHIAIYIYLEKLNTFSLVMLDRILQKETRFRGRGKGGGGEGGGGEGGDSYSIRW